MLTAAVHSNPPLGLSRSRDMNLFPECKPPYGCPATVKLQPRFGPFPRISKLFNGCAKLFVTNSQYSVINSEGQKIGGIRDHGSDPSVEADQGRGCGSSEQADERDHGDGRQVVGWYISGSQSGVVGAEPSGVRSVGPAGSPLTYVNHPTYGWLPSSNRYLALLAGRVAL